MPVSRLMVLLFICHDQQTSLVMSKSRVALIKIITLPKLEFMAAVMVSRLVQFIRASIHLQTDNPSSNIHMWTDSQIVLHWIYKPPKSNSFMISHTVLQRLLEHLQPIHGPSHHLMITLLIS